jgi:uncharacterized protein with NAD-binding domain and iron-sulfur cluster
MDNYLRRTMGMVGTLLRALHARTRGSFPPPWGAPAGPFPGLPSPDQIASGLSRLLGLGMVGGLEASLEVLHGLRVALERAPFLRGDHLLGMIDTSAQVMRAQLDRHLRGDDELRALADLTEISLATLRGTLRAGQPNRPGGFDVVDQYECREFLRMNGASERALGSGFLRGLYDLGFAHEDGDPARPRISAAAALRGAHRLFYTYRGSFFWKMTAGMGEVVFSPLYDVLRRRRVRFEFFHRLAGVRLAPGHGQRSSVEALDFDVQARTRDGAPYRPLIDVRGLPCWPRQPDFGQLADGDTLAREGWDFESPWDNRKAGSRSLRAGEDFDVAILAVGVGALPFACRELLARDERWRAAVQHVKSTPTHAFQLWMREGMAELGWPHAGASLSGFEKPFDTWADMSHLIGAESWPAPGPRSLVYFCSAMPTPGGPASRTPSAWRHAVEADATAFLDQQIGHLWPGAVGPQGFRWDLLVDPAGTPGPADRTRFRSQHYTANVNPSDGYTLALPGSRQYRLSPLDDTYANLRVAGDWTDTRLNLGSVEAAVMSGKLAAHAVAGAPALSEIVGYDQP